MSPAGTLSKRYVPSSSAASDVVVTPTTLPFTQSFTSARPTAAPDSGRRMRPVTEPAACNCTVTSTVAPVATEPEVRPESPLYVALTAYVPSVNPSNGTMPPLPEATTAYAC